ncbi:MAG: TIGR03009 domain-containing protein [Bacteroidales bacterium]|nr:TIGR03009 domain-containing protein [Bacteroidales bacterium]
MRRVGLTLTALLFAAPAVLSQTPPFPGQTGGQRVPVPGSGTPIGTQPGGLPAPVPATGPVDPKLKAHLDQWEGIMRQITNFYGTCTRVKKHLVLDKKAEYNGTLICMKPNLARMRIDRKDKPEEYVAYICSGRAVYEYDGSQKTLTEYKLANGGVGDNLLLSFMSGTMTANDLLGRFDMKLLKEDQNYIYLEVRPRFPRDKQEFESMTLVLFQPSVPGVAYLPRAVVMRMANGQEEERWDFPRPAVNVPGVKAQDFEPVQPPKDWKVQQAQQQPQPGPTAPPGQPRVARPATP